MPSTAKGLLNVFASAGLTHRNGYDPIDPENVYAALEYLADQVKNEEIRLVVRNGAAADFLMERLGYPDGDRFKILEGDEEEEIKILNSQSHYPSLVVLAGGIHDVEADYKYFSRSEVPIVPLPQTGGAASLADEWQKTSSKRPWFLVTAPEATVGRLTKSLQDLVQQKARAQSAWRPDSEICALIGIRPQVLLNPLSGSRKTPLCPAPRRRPPTISSLTAIRR